MEEKRLIYDTLQRRLNEARFSAKTSEQQLRDLYHILDSTQVLAVGEKIVIERNDGKNFDASAALSRWGVSSGAAIPADDELVDASKQFLLVGSLHDGCRASVA